ncbi:hypothetical protein ACFLZV_05500, partial [Candidatus Margulisiibacteriota bacterium]
MKYLLLVLIIFFSLLTKGAEAQMPGGSSLSLVETYKLSQHRQARRNKDLSNEEKIDQIQAYFINKIFLDEFFKLQNKKLFI